MLIYLWVLFHFYLISKVKHLQHCNLERLNPYHPVQTLIEFGCLQKVFSSSLLMVTTTTTTTMGSTAAVFFCVCFVSYGFYDFIPHNPGGRGESKPISPLLQFFLLKIMYYTNSFTENARLSNLTFWRPRAPSNYVVLGDCVTSRYKIYY